MEVSVELREVLLNERPQSLYKFSSKGTVPVLLLKDGKVLDESLDIMQWAIKQGEQKLYEDKLNEQNQLIKYNDTKFKYWLDKYKYHVRYLEHSREYYQRKCSKTLAEYDMSLRENEYLMGDRIRLADIAIFPFIRQCANVDQNWFNNKYPNLNQWLEIWKQSRLFKSVMMKYNQWRLGDELLIVNFQ
jgi:glutathione S-transferase